MFEPNVPKVLELIERKPEAMVLDVGGCACPFNRANWVIDHLPFEERGFYEKFGMPSSQGGGREFFAKEAWVQRDICERTPWPFEDKCFDFAVCSHTLEDVRGPLSVCSELVRVARAGYIESPSRAAESSRGWESPRIAGLSHHRWLIEVEGTHARFTPKYHSVHADFRFAFPRSYLKKLAPADRVTFLFWEGEFTFEEVLLRGDDRFESLRKFVADRYRYPGYRLWLWSLGRLLRRVVGGIRRRLLPGG